MLAHYIPFEWFSLNFIQMFSSVHESATHTGGHTSRSKDSVGWVLAIFQTAVLITKRLSWSGHLLSNSVEVVLHSQVPVILPVNHISISPLNILSMYHIRNSHFITVKIKLYHIYSLHISTFWFDLYKIEFLAYVLFKLPGLQITVCSWKLFYLFLNQSILLLGSSQQLIVTLSMP